MKKILMLWTFVALLFVADAGSVDLQLTWPDGSAETLPKR